MLSVIHTLTLTSQVVTLQKKKLYHVLDVAKVKLKKEGTKHKYKVWSKTWDNLNKWTVLFFIL